MSVPNVRAADVADFDFAWTIYSITVKPHIEPEIQARFARAWIDEDERVRFASWWSAENSRIIEVDGAPAGWLHFEITDNEVHLQNFCIAPESRRQGIASYVLAVLLQEWKGKNVRHSVLKGSADRHFFEKRGFQSVDEDDLTTFMTRRAEHIQPMLKHEVRV